MRKMLAGTLIVVAGLLFLSVSAVLAQGEPCTADFNCDRNVDGGDVGVFLQHFGRSQYNNPCPDCYDSQCPCTAPGCDPPAPVEKTGQTTSYATGDDGDHEKGITWPNPRFTDNFNGTVTDNLTGLIWLKNANCFGTRAWNGAIGVCNGLANGQCGLTDGSTNGDWRLPNRSELLSLIDLEYDNPALCNTECTGQWEEGHPFTNVQSYGYWSSSTSSDNTNYAWGVSMWNGDSGRAGKSHVYYNVWPVRGGH